MQSDGTSHKTKPNLLFMASFFPTRIFPFKGPFIRNFANVASTDFHLTVLTVEADTELKSGYQIEKNPVDNFTQYTVFYNPNYSKLPILKSVLNFYHFFIGCIKAYKEIVIDRGPINIHHLHSSVPMGIFALYLKYVKNTPYVFSEQVTIYIYDRFQQLPFYSKWLHKLIFKNASAISGLTEYHGQEIEKCGLAKNINVIPNVIDIRNYDCKENINSENSFKWVHISTLSPVKGVEDQIRALSLVLQKGFSVEFSIIGGDPSRIEELKSLAKECGVENNIHWLGWLDREHFVPILKASDLFLLNSEFETFCVVAAEALACGLPVVCPSIGPLKEFIHEKNGVFFDERTPANIANAAIECMNHLNSYNPQKISNEVQEKFGPETVLNSFKELYLSIKY
jgi:glycosyltransferase involved in cell wall biosynthesis